MTKRGWVIALGSMFAFSGLSQTPASNSARLVALLVTEIKALRGRLDAALLPAGASHLQISKGQTFALTAGQETMLTLVPVEFYVTTQDRFLSVCGLYVLPPSGPESLTVTYGMREERDEDDVEDSWECARTTAMGVMPNEGKYPRLLMTMAGFSPPRHEVVMAWDAKKATYVLQTGVFHDNSFVGDATVAKMRRLLQAR